MLGCSFTKLHSPEPSQSLIAFQDKDMFSLTFCVPLQEVWTHKYSLITVINQRYKTLLQDFTLSLIFNILAVLLLQDLLLSMQVYEEKIWLLRHIHVTDLQTLLLSYKFSIFPLNVHWYVFPFWLLWPNSELKINPSWKKPYGICTVKVLVIKRVVMIAT